MSDINNKYKQILKDLEDNIKDPEELKFVKERFSELSMMFIDMIDRVTQLTDMKIKEIEEKQQNISERLNNVQKSINDIESDIYEEDENGDNSYEFEIVCPYCNHEFTTDIEEDGNDEIECPECHNTIELDWNCDDEGCQGGCCSTCESHCEEVAEENEDYNSDDDKEDM